MTDLIPKAKPVVIEETFDTCNTCKFAVVDVRQMDMIACHGAPPVPVVMGMTPQGPALSVLRPSLPRGTRACGMHKRELVVLARTM